MKLPEFPRILPHLRHALQMVGRNRRAYGKLSVTVVLSFTLLLAYMAWTDAGLYNRYAKVFSLPRQVVQCYTYDKGISELFARQVDQVLPESEHYTYFSATTELTAYTMDLNAQCFFIPQGIETVYAADNSPAIDAEGDWMTPCVEPVKLLGEKQDFYLQGNETIINESFYRSLLAGGAKEPFAIPLTFYWGDGSHSLWELEVVGVCQDQYDNLFIKSGADSGDFGYVTLYLSHGLLAHGPGELPPATRHLTFVNSESPEQVLALGRSLGMVSQGIVESQDQARLDIRESLKSKATISAVILLLLAINLYSSFSNVLETRNYEIGIKRAVGASKWSVIRQFLYEGLLVLGFDSILSAALVADGLILYKLFRKVFMSSQWIIYVSPYSIGIYGLTALGLTITFSLIFAYRSTRVEVVKYLKSE